MCEHTYWENSYKNRDLSFESLKRLVDSIPNLKWINLTGEGSSILNPEFLDMLQYVKSKGIYVDFSHDFFQLSDEAAQTCVMEGVERIFISIDGATKETYEAVRVGSNLSRVVENIKRLIEWKKEYRSPLPEICFRMTVFDKNVHEVEDWVDFIHSIAPTKDLGNKPELNIVGLLEFEQTKGWEVEIPEQVFHRVAKKCKEYGFELNWSHPSHLSEEKPPLEFCLAWTEPYIIIGGHEIPCCAMVMSNKRAFLEEHSFGNIEEQPLKEIWESDRFKEFRKTVVNGKAQVPILCNGCRMFDTTRRAERYGVVE